MIDAARSRTARLARMLWLTAEFVPEELPGDARRRATPVRRIASMTASATVKTDELRISADSHMGEPLNLWVENLPANYRDRALRWPKLKEFETNHHLRAGCWDPHARLADLAFDGTSAEVLFPTQAADAWRVGDL